MAKHFGKILLATAAVASLAATAWYLISKKEVCKEEAYSRHDREGHPRPSAPLSSGDQSSRSYVSLDKEPAAPTPDPSEAIEEVEEFFDEEDPVPTSL